MVWKEAEVEKKLREKWESNIRALSAKLTVGDVTFSSFQQLENGRVTEEEKRRVGWWLLYLAAGACQAIYLLECTKCDEENPKGH